MLNFIRKIRNTVLVNTGFNPILLLKALGGVGRFFSDLFKYSRMNNKLSKPFRFSLSLMDSFPILTDFGDSAGSAQGHYFHQDLWVARKIYKAKPSEHYDVGSRIDGFITSLLTFMPVTVMDVRPLTSHVPGLTFIQQDATHLAGFPDQSIGSLSTLHAVEHFGLGRYGDPVDPDACFKAMRSFARVLKPGGRLYFSVPIGRERLEFNAQRVFSPLTILEVFKDLKLVSFAAVNDKGEMDDQSPPEAFVNANFSCGMYEFTKGSS